MKTKIFSLALLLMITAVGMWAQNLPGNPASPTGSSGTFPAVADSSIWSSSGIWTSNIWSSPQSDTTEGRFRSYADDFIRPDSWTGVKFNKWLGLVSFKSSTYANVGFATKIKNVYIGAFYNGQFWANAPVNNYTESGSNHSYSNPINLISVPSTTTSSAQVINPINNVAVLIGVANMGFRLTFRTNYQRFNEDGIIVSSTPYTNYKAEYGYLTPQIAWAMAKDLTKNGIRPYAAFDLNIFRNYLKTEESSSPGENISKSLNHIDPIFSLGLGGYTLYNKDGFKLSADLDYVLAFNVFDNEYSETVGGAYKTSKIKGTYYYDGSDSIYSERFSVFNQVTPSLSGSWSKDRLALKFKLNLVLNFANENQAAMDLDPVSHNLFYEGNSDEAFTFTFRPDLRLAMQYKIIPDRLTLNVGARLQASLLTAKTTDRTTYSSGTVTSSKVHSNSMGNDFLTRFSIGLAFNLTENFWTEATAGVSNASTSGSISIFKDDGLFAFGSLLVGLKF